MKVALDMNTVRKLDVKKKIYIYIYIYRNKCKFQIWGYLSGSRLAVFWDIHTNILNESIVAIYRREDVISHKNESLNRNFTVF
jgi:hypothetical protein